MAYTRLSGIYQIRSLSSGKVYVGSAVSIKARWASHLSQLRRSVHQNKHLQHAWLKYGTGNFQFSVLEFCSVEDLVSREQHWIDCLLASDPNHGMNNSPTASTSIGFKHSEQTKALLSEIARKRDFSHLRELAKQRRGKPSHSRGTTGQKWTDEMRKKASIQRKGRKTWNVGVPMRPEVKAKVSQTMIQLGIGRTIPQEMRDKVIRMRSNGDFYADISKQTGISVAQAHRISKHIPVGPRRGMRTYEKVKGR